MKGFVSCQAKQRMQLLGKDAFHRLAQRTAADAAAPSAGQTVAQDGCVRHGEIRQGRRLRPELTDFRQIVRFRPWIIRPHGCMTEDAEQNVGEPLFFQTVWIIADGLDDVAGVPDIPAFVQRLLIIDGEIRAVTLPGFQILVAGDEIGLPAQRFCRLLAGQIVEPVHGNVETLGNPHKVVQIRGSRTGFPPLDGLTGQTELLCKFFL